VQGYRYVSRDGKDVRIPILGASSFLEKTGLASMSSTVLAVAVMPTYEHDLAPPKTILDIISLVTCFFL